MSNFQYLREFKQKDLTDDETTAHLSCVSDSAPEKQGSTLGFIFLPVKCCHLAQHIVLSEVSLTWREGSAFGWDLP